MLQQQQLAQQKAAEAAQEALTDSAKRLQFKWAEKVAATSSINQVKSLEQIQQEEQERVAKTRVSLKNLCISVFIFAGAILRIEHGMILLTATRKRKIRKRKSSSERKRREFTKCQYLGWSVQQSELVKCREHWWFLG